MKNINIFLFSIFLNILNPVSCLIVSTAVYKKTVNEQDYYVFLFGDAHIGDKGIQVSLQESDQKNLDKTKDFLPNIFKIAVHANEIQANQFSKILEKYKTDSLVLYEDMNNYDEYFYFQKLIHDCKIDKSDIKNDHVIHILKNNNFFNIFQKSFDFRLIFNHSARFKKKDNSNFLKEDLIKELKAIIDKLLNVQNDKLKKYFEKILLPLYDKMDLLINDSNFLSILIDLNILYEIETYYNYKNKFIFTGYTHTKNLHQGLLLMDYKPLIKEGFNGNMIPIYFKVLYNTLIQCTCFKKNGYEMFQASNIEKFFNQISIQL